MQARKRLERDRRPLSSHTSNLYFYIKYNTAPGAPPASLSNSPEDPSCELDERRFSQSLVVPFFVGAGEFLLPAFTAIFYFQRGLAAHCGFLRISRKLNLKATLMFSQGKMRMGGGESESPDGDRF